MSGTLVFVQVLNGLQFGVLLFLIAAGLTLVFGVMDFINLAHGVQYMLGAYLAVMFYGLTGNFLAALVLALAAALAFGLFLEFVVFRHLYGRDHLDQVIATFGIILFLNEGVKFVWGAAPLSLPVPEIFVTADDVTFGKPDPEPYRRAAAALGVPEAECVVVEDAPMGVLAAKRAGMTVLAVATTHAPAALGQADLVFPGMADVSGWLGARAGDVQAG